MTQYIPRFYNELEEYCLPGKALILYGARQVGKTTLVKHYLSNCNYRYKFDSGDNIQTRNTLSQTNLKTLQEYIAGYELLVIDEAQKIPNIGETIKLLVDQIPNLRVIATGSSSFELAGQIGEPLTGRKTTLSLYPIAQLELSKLYNPYELKVNLEDWLVYGSYPEIIQCANNNEKRERIVEITESYLLKDILQLDRIKNSKVLLDLLRLLAFQLGNEISYAELSQKLILDAKTVARYLDLLEKGFVIYNLRGFSRNLRKEITKKSKYYFYDNGIRNALIANFNPIEMRDDIGKLWENFLMIERLKKRKYTKMVANDYFWRTWDKKEIDLVEEREGKLFGYEFKWGDQKIKAPKDWLQTYSEATFSVINKDNYLPFVIDKD